MIERNPLGTSARLVSATAERLQHGSYHGTGVDELCRLAGVNKGSLYHFFPSKTDLVVAAIESTWTEMRVQVFEPIAQSGAPGLDRLTRLVARVDAAQRQGLVDTQRPLGCPFGSLGQEMAPHVERIKAAVQAVFDGHCEYLRAWLDEASGARQIPPGDNARRARQVFALFEGALLLSRVAGDPDVFTDVCAVLPVVAGRTGPASTRGSGVAPELL